MSTSQHVIDVTEQTFQTQVIQACMTTPIIVDFWAEWCGPCKTLGPILEETAEAYKGAFVLAKVDVDRNQQLAAYFQAQSIPMVIALFQGQVVGSFTGAQPKAKVRQFVDETLARCGVEASTDEAPVPEGPEEAESHWKAKLDKDPEDGEALLELGRLRMQQGDDVAARELFQQVKGAMPQFSAAQAALALGELFNAVKEAGGDQAVRARLDQLPEDAEAIYLVACANAALGKYVEGLSALVDLIAGSACPPDVKTAARSAVSTIFEVAGRGDEEVEGLRRKLARLLF